MLKPYPLSAGRIDDAALAEDRKTCRKIGPCGIGRHALYLNSFFFDIVHWTANPVTLCIMFRFPW